MRTVQPCKHMLYGALQMVWRPWEQGELMHTCSYFVPPKTISFIVKMIAAGNGTIILKSFLSVGKGPCTILDRSTYKGRLLIEVSGQLDK